MILKAWILFPLLVCALGLAWGLLAEALAGRPLPGPLLAGVGLALLIVATQPLSLADASAELIVPAALGFAAAGVMLGQPRGRKIDLWAVAAAAGAFVVYAVPFVLSGEATLGGYIKLDDTASWLGITDRVMEHGHSLAGLAPSSYEAMLDFYVGSRYPVGGFLPLGIGGVLTGEDIAWLYQPYLAVLAALLALALYGLAEPLIASRPARAAAAVLAAQPAITFAYALWGGVKEVAAAWLLALAVALLPQAVRELSSLRALLPLAVTAAATLAVLSLGGALWLVPVLALALVLALRRHAPRLVARRAAPFVATVLLLSIPPLLSAGFLGNPAASTITDESRLANLIQPLSVLQVLGIWPTGEFRLRPDEMAATYVLVAVVGLMAIAGLAYAARRRDWVLIGYVAAGLFGCVVTLAVASPWVQAKALATAAPALLLAALAGVAALARAGRRVEAVVAASAVAGGVLWSNGLGYHEVNLAPSERFEELAEIGDRIAGEGPTLTTEYEPFAVRYFLREADPEGASELRRRPVQLRSGKTLDKGQVADLDAFQPSALLVYRTLVLRRSPLESQPPSPYRIVWRGRYYEVWQRDGRGGAGLGERLPLGPGPPNVAKAPCGEVLRVARRAAGARLVAVERPAPRVVDLAGTALPPGWTAGETAGTVLPTREGTIQTTFDLPTAGRHELWIGGAVRGLLTAEVNGRRVGAVRHELSHAGHYLLLGEAGLARGSHVVELRYEKGVRPGSGGRPFELGPLVLVAADRRPKMLSVPADRAHTLCGRTLDWVEAAS